VNTSAQWGREDFEAEEGRRPKLEKMIADWQSMWIQEIGRLLKPRKNTE